MGIDWGPCIGPAATRLLITNFANEPNTFLCQNIPTS